MRKCQFFSVLAWTCINFLENMVFTENLDKIINRKKVELKQIEI